MMGEYKQDKVRGVLAANLKRYRSALGLSQEKFAEKVSLGHSMIAAIENQKKYPSSDSLNEICSFLNIEPYQLFLPENLTKNDSVSELGSLRERMKEDLNTLVNDRFREFITK